MKLRNTTTYEIEKIIKSLKNKNSYGCDEISTRILKVSAPYDGFCTLLLVLFHIYVESVNTTVTNPRKLLPEYSLY
jgi:hypothetical protein